MTRLLPKKTTILSIILIVLTVLAWHRFSQARQRWNFYEKDSVTATIRVVDGFAIERDFKTITPGARWVEIGFDRTMPLEKEDELLASQLSAVLDISEHGRLVYHEELPPTWGTFGSNRMGVLLSPLSAAPGAYHFALRIRRSSPELDGAKPRFVIRLDPKLTKEFYVKGYLALLLFRVLLAFSVIALICVAAAYAVARLRQRAVLRPDDPVPRLR